VPAPGHNGNRLSERLNYITGTGMSSGAEQSAINSIVIYVSRQASSHLTSISQYRRP
jgi:hypothetical protein